MSNHLSEAQKQEIIRLYCEEKLSRREVIERTGIAIATANRLLKGLRSHAEAMQIARNKGVGKMTEAGREKMSRIGQQACRRNRKFWTKPERLFRDILNDLNIGVQFPDYIIDIININSDPNPEICYQYPIQRYVCDYVDVNRGIVYRINGDFWHANPLLYDAEKLCKIQQHNTKQDANSRIYLEKQGWLVCDIWESEIYWNKLLVEQKIRETRGLGDPPALHAGPAEFDSQVSHVDWSEQLKELWFSSSSGIVHKTKRKREKVSQECKKCTKVFETVPSHARDYCSPQCASHNRRKTEHPTKDQLAEHLETMSWCAIGRLYGVSDNAVRKWARRYQIIK